jgi:hypothetical protein
MEESKEESKEQCAARGGQLAVERSRPSSCRNPQPTVASHENQEAQRHEQLGATTRACPLERNPPQRLKMVMPASARSNWKAHLGATFGRTLDGKNPNGWFREQKLSVAETIEAYTMGSGYAEFEEQEKGLITIGKLVDMVPISRRRILDRPGKNPRRSSSENICSVKIDLRCRCNREVTMVRAEVSEPKCLTDSGTDGRHWERSRETTSRYQCQSPACSSLTTRWMFQRPH